MAITVYTQTDNPNQIITIFPDEARHTREYNHNSKMNPALSCRDSGELHSQSTFGAYVQHKTIAMPASEADLIASYDPHLTTSLAAGGPAPSSTKTTEWDSLPSPSSAPSSPSAVDIFTYLEAERRAFTATVHQHRLGDAFMSGLSPAQKEQLVRQTVIGFNADAPKGVIIESGRITNFFPGDRPVVLSLPYQDRLPFDSRHFERIFAELVIGVYYLDSSPNLSIEPNAVGTKSVLMDPFWLSTFTGYTMARLDRAQKSIYRLGDVSDQNLEAWRNRYYRQARYTLSELETNGYVAYKSSKAAQRRIEKMASALESSSFQGLGAFINAAQQRIKQFETMLGFFPQLELIGIQVRASQTGPIDSIVEGECKIRADAIIYALVEDAQEDILETLKSHAQFREGMELLKWIGAMVMTLQTLKAQGRIPVVDWSILTGSSPAIPDDFPPSPFFEGKLATSATLTGGCKIGVEPKDARVSRKSYKPLWEAVSPLADAAEQAKMVSFEFRERVFKHQHFAWVIPTREITEKTPSELEPAIVSCILGLHHVVHLRQQLVARPGQVSKEAMESAVWQGRSLLGFALLTGDRTLLPILCQNGVRLNTVGTFGQTAWDMALQSDTDHMLPFLAGVRTLQTSPATIPVSQQLAAASVSLRALLVYLHQWSSRQAELSGVEVLAECRSESEWRTLLKGTLGTPHVAKTMRKHERDLTNHRDIKAAIEQAHRILTDERLSLSEMLTRLEPLLTPANAARIEALDTVKTNRVRTNFVCGWRQMAGMVNIIRRGSGFELLQHAESELGRLIEIMETTPELRNHPEALRWLHMAGKFRTILAVMPDEIKRMRAEIQAHLRLNLFCDFLRLYTYGMNFGGEEYLIGHLRRGNDVMRLKDSVGETRLHNYGTGLRFDISLKGILRNLDIDSEKLIRSADSMEKRVWAIMEPTPGYYQTYFLDTVLPSAGLTVTRNGALGSGQSKLVFENFNQALKAIESLSLWIFGEMLAPPTTEQLAMALQSNKSSTTSLMHRLTPGASLVTDLSEDVIASLIRQGQSTEVANLIEWGYPALTARQNTPTALNRAVVGATETMRATLADYGLPTRSRGELEDIHQLEERYREWIPMWSEYELKIYNHTAGKKLEWHMQKINKLLAGFTLDSLRVIIPRLLDRINKLTKFNEYRLVSAHLQQLLESLPPEIRPARFETVSSETVMGVIDSRNPSDLSRLVAESGVDTVIDPQGNTILHAVVASGWIAGVGLMVTNGAKIITNHNKRSPLHIAAHLGDTAILKRLAPCLKGITPTQVAQSTFFSAVRRLDFDAMLGAILDGARIDALDPQTGTFAAYSFASLGLTDWVSALVILGTPVDLSTRDLNTMLSGACQNGHRHTAQYLRHARARTQVYNSRHETPQMMAARSGHSALASALSADPIKISIVEPSVFSRLRSGDPITASEIDVRAISANGWPVLCAVAAARRWDLIPELVERGANPAAPTPEGRNVIHFAMLCGRNDEWMAVGQQPENRPIGLIEPTPWQLWHQAYWSPEEPVSREAIRSLVMQNQPLLVANLLARHPQLGNSIEGQPSLIELAWENRNLPMMALVGDQQGEWVDTGRVAGLLSAIDYQQLLTAANPTDMTCFKKLMGIYIRWGQHSELRIPGISALVEGHNSQLLAALPNLNPDAKAMLLGHVSRTNDDAKWLILMAAGANPTGNDDRNPTAVGQAWRSCQTSRIRYLLAEKHMPSPTDFAVYVEQERDSLQVIAQFEAVSPVIKRSINDRVYKGSTLFTIAARVGNEPLVKALAGAGAASSIPTEDGKLPIFFANQFGHEDIVTYLHQTFGQSLDISTRLKHTAFRVRRNADELAAAMRE